MSLCLLLFALVRARRPARERYRSSGRWALTCAGVGGAGVGGAGGAGAGAGRVEDVASGGVWCGPRLICHSSPLPHT